MICLMASAFDVAPLTHGWVNVHEEIENGLLWSSLFEHLSNRQVCGGHFSLPAGSVWGENTVRPKLASVTQLSLSPERGCKSFLRHSLLIDFLYRCKWQSLQFMVSFTCMHIYMAHAHTYSNTRMQRIPFKSVGSVFTALSCRAGCMMTQMN